jgi:FMN phosphatase YigB (HAD superfamily)
MTRRFDLVVLDVGGVLVRTGRTWGEDAALAGFTFSPAWLEQFEARRRSLPRLDAGEVDGERYFALLAEASGGVLTPDDAQRITRASPIAEYPGIGRVFDALDAAGIETALLMNLNEEEWARFFPETASASEFPTLSRAPHRFASHLMHAAKPDPRAYATVERETGHAGERILFFDDRAENVAAAQSLGWTAEQIDHTGDTPSQILDQLRRHGVTS